MKSKVRKIISKYLFPLLTGVILLAIISFAITNSTADTSSLTYMTAKSNEEWNALLIKNIKSNLQSDKLNSDDRKLLEGKLLDAEMLATREASFGNIDMATAWAAKQTAIAQATSSPLFSAQSTIEKLSGIVLDKSHIGFNKIDKFTNYWAQDYKDDNLLIFVGYEITNPGQGIICVVIGTPIQDPAIRIKVPGNTGKLTLTKNEEDWLFINSENGFELKFNRYTYQLIDVKTGKEIPIEITETKSQELTAYP